MKRKKIEQPEQNRLEKSIKALDKMTALGVVLDQSDCKMRTSGNLCLVFAMWGENLVSFLETNERSKVNVVQWTKYPSDGNHRALPDGQKEGCKED